MRKGFVMLVMMVGFTAFLSCERENNPMDDSATTRGASVNDSTDNNGGITITVDTTWNGETHINF